MKRNNLTAVIFAVAAVILMPLRILQYSTVLEPQTGFYRKMDWSVYIFAAVLGFALLFFLADGIAKKNRLVLVCPQKKDIPCGIIALVTAFLTVLQGYQSLTFNKVSTITAEPQINISAVNRLAGLFGFVAAVYFLLVAVQFFSGKGCGTKLRILSLMPVIWCMLRLVLRFTKAISYARVSELFLNMMMLAFFVLFTMYYAIVNGNVRNYNYDWKVHSYGYCAALLALVNLVPNICLTIAGKSAVMYADCVLEYCDLAIAFFIIVTVITRVEKKEATPADE